MAEDNILESNSLENSLKLGEDESTSNREYANDQLQETKLLDDRDVRMQVIDQKPSKDIPILSTKELDFPTNQNFDPIKFVEKIRGEDWETNGSLTNDDIRQVRQKSSIPDPSNYIKARNDIENKTQEIKSTNIIQEDRTQTSSIGASTNILNNEFIKLQMDPLQNSVFERNYGENWTETYNQEDHPKDNHKQIQHLVDSNESSTSKNPIDLFRPTPTGPSSYQEDQSKVNQNTFAQIESIDKYRETKNTSGDYMPQQKNISNSKGIPEQLTPMRREVQVVPATPIQTDSLYGPTSTNNTSPIIMSDGYQAQESPPPLLLPNDQQMSESPPPKANISNIEYNQTTTNSPLVLSENQQGYDRQPPLLLPNDQQMSESPPPKANISNIEYNQTTTNPPLVLSENQQGYDRQPPLPSQSSASYNTSYNSIESPTIKNIVVDTSTTKYNTNLAKLNSELRDSNRAQISTDRSIGVESRRTNETPTTEVYINPEETKKSNMPTSEIGVGGIENTSTPQMNSNEIISNHIKRNSPPIWRTVLG